MFGRKIHARHEPFALQSLRRYFRRTHLWLPDLLAIALASLLGFIIVSAEHALPAGRVALGFVHIDQVVYYANAREVFENGNGFTYGSPYSNRPDSPRIYSQFTFLLFAYLNRLPGLSFETIDYWLRMIFGAAALMLAVRIIRAALPIKRLLTSASILALVAGGLAFIIALIHTAQDHWILRDIPNLSQGFSAWFGTFQGEFRQTESGYGEWQLNLFRSILYTPEAVYHTLFFACILCMIRRKRVPALIFLLLVWWSHPFTGVLLGSIAAVFFSIEALLRQPKALSSLAATLALDAAFLFYYLVFLGRFEEHASVYQQMREFGNPMLLHKLLPAYGFFLFLPLLYWLKPRFRRHLRTRPAVRLLAIWLFCAAALVFHDRFVFFFKPIQPMHFTRGYLFLPLAFFSVCGVQEIFSRQCRKRRWRALGTLAFVIALQAPDNAYNLVNLRARLARTDAPFSIAVSEKELLDRMDAIPETLTLYFLNSPKGPLSHPSTLNALTPVLTHHRAILAHAFNTPYYREKFEAADRLSQNITRENIRALRLTALGVNRTGLEQIRNALNENEYEVLLEFDGVVVVRFHLDPENKDGADRSERL